MGKEYTNDELAASFVLPDPISGNDWGKYEDTKQEALDKREDNIRALARAALAIIESGTYKVAGDVHDLKKSGLDAPLEVLVWVGIEINAAIASKLTIPKASSENA